MVVVSNVEHLFKMKYTKISKQKKKIKYKNFNYLLNSMMELFNYHILY